MYGAGWFLYEDRISYCTVQDVEGDHYHVIFTGQRMAIHKSHRFPTLLAAQLHNKSHRLAFEIQEHKTDLLFFQEMSKHLEKDVEETDHKWFVQWGFLGNKDFKIKHMLWRHFDKGTRPQAESFEVQVLYKGKEWVPIPAYLGFKTEGAAHFYAQGKILEERIEDEQRLLKWLISFSKEPEKHGQDLEYAIAEVG